MKDNIYILSPCGTSLLTNEANTEERKLVFKYANNKNKDDILDEDRDLLEKLINNICKKLDGANYQTAQKMSAELNGIIKIYDSSLSKSTGDYHFLLATDTWLGEETAKLVEKWLRQINPKMIVVVHRQLDLQTEDLFAFQFALSELVKKFDEELKSWSAQGYKIIFNLTGGFKGVIGFLQSIANFFADETVYIFEKSTELMRIPRLPIKMDAVYIIEENISFFRNLSIGVSKKIPNGLPDALLLRVDTENSFSAWGEVLWVKSKDEIYEKKLYPTPNQNKIRYGQKFTDKINSLQKDRVKLINERIDQLNKHFIDDGYNPPSLDFKQLKGKKMLPSTHEIDAWSDLDAKRIFGHFEGECFVLDRLEKGLH